MTNLSHLFSEDTIETKTYIVCSESEVYYMGIDDDMIKQVLPLIETALSQGKTYINVKHLNLVYKGRYWDDNILEITWD